MIPPSGRSPANISFHVLGAANRTYLQLRCTHLAFGCELRPSELWQCTKSETQRAAAAGLVPGNKYVLVLPVPGREAGWLTARCVSFIVKLGSAPGREPPSQVGPKRNAIFFKNTKGLLSDQARVAQRRPVLNKSSVWYCPMQNRISEACISTGD